MCLSLCLSVCLCTKYLKQFCYEMIWLKFIEGWGVSMFQGTTDPERSRSGNFYLLLSAEVCALVSDCFVLKYLNIKMWCYPRLIDTVTVAANNYADVCVRFRLKLWNDDRYRCRCCSLCAHHHRCRHHPSTALQERVSVLLSM